MLEEIGDYLQAAGFGKWKGPPPLNMFLQYAPDSPDVLIMLAEMPGMPHEWQLGIDGPAVENPILHVAVRAAPYDYPTARVLLDKLRAALTFNRPMVFTGTLPADYGSATYSTYYRRTYPHQSMHTREDDEKGRPILCFELQVEKEPS